METIEFEGEIYPAWQATGNAARFARPFALEVCKGIGYDIGCNRSEWAFPGAVQIDPVITPDYDALNLPFNEADYIFSSHMIEHINGRFQDVIEYWLTMIKKGGHIFLYLPNCDHQKYWAWGNKKHIHYLSPKIMAQYCNTLNVNSYFVTEGHDLNSSFYCIIEK